MTLEMISYGGKSQLVVYLGERPGRYVYVKEEAFDDAERQTLRAGLAELSDAPFEQRAAWLRARCPNAWRFGFRNVPLAAVQRHAAYALAQN